MVPPITMPAVRIVLLTGASSSGKTSIAKSLQSRLTQPFFHMQLDTFIEMMPRQDDDLFCAMVLGFHRSIASMAGVGNNVIVDHVLLLPEWLQDCAQVLLDFKVLLVGVVCPLAELERREQTRDVRRQGFARSQFDRIHEGRTYDIEVCTDLFTPNECADQILQYYHTQTPSALAQVRSPQ